MIFSPPSLLCNRAKCKPPSIPLILSLTPAEVDGNWLEDVKYCNSIGCPNSFTPIKNAMEVACEDNKCEVSQCCEAFCSYYACPNGYIPTVDAATTLCDNQTCTTAQCCIKH